MDPYTQRPMHQTTHRFYRLLQYDRRLPSGDPIAQMQTVRPMDGRHAAAVSSTDDISRSQIRRTQRQRRLHCLLQSEQVLQTIHHLLVPLQHFATSCPLLHKVEQPTAQQTHVCGIAVSTQTVNELFAANPIPAAQCSILVPPILSTQLPDDPICPIPNLVAERSPPISTLSALELKELGNTLFKQRQFDAAIEMHDKAIALAPNEFDYYNNKCAVWLMMSDSHHDDVLTMCQDLIARRDDICQLNPGGATPQKVAKTYSRMASVYEKQRKYDCATTMYQKAIKMSDTPTFRQQLQRLTRLHNDSVKQKSALTATHDKNQTQHCHSASSASHHIATACDADLNEKLLSLALALIMTVAHDIRLRDNKKDTSTVKEELMITTSALVRDILQDRASGQRVARTGFHICATEFVDAIITTFPSTSSSPHINSAILDICALHLCEAAEFWQTTC